VLGNLIESTVVAWSRQVLWSLRKLDDVLLLECLLGQCGFLLSQLLRCLRPIDFGLFIMALSKIVVNVLINFSWDVGQIFVKHVSVGLLVCRHLARVTGLRQGCCEACRVIRHSILGGCWLCHLETAGYLPSIHIDHSDGALAHLLRLGKWRLVWSLLCLSCPCLAASVGFHHWRHKVVHTLYVAWANTKHCLVAGTWHGWV